jgi:hypothetical protein
MRFQHLLYFGIYVCYAGFEVLTPVVMKSRIFWNITPCSPVKDNQVSEDHIGLFFDREVGSDIFFRNVD